VDIGEPSCNANGATMSLPQVPPVNQSRNGPACGRASIFHYDAEHPKEVDRLNLRRDEELP
jgi:hypothetical protein